MNPNLRFLKDNIAHKRIIGLQGSTRSGKSYSAIQFLIKLATQHSGMRISICRDTFNALKSTDMYDFFELLNEAGLYRSQDYNRTDHLYYLNGNLFEFFGLDSPGKVQGRKRHILFVDEAIEADWEVVTQLKLRTSHRIIYAFNPSLIEHPIYADLERSDACKIITTYKDNPYLNDDQVREIEMLKLNDPELWRVYGEGLPAQARHAVYVHYKVEPKQVVDEFVYGLDIGYEHPMALVEVGKLPDGSAQWHEVIYGQGMTTADLMRLMDGKVSKRHRIYVDSARPDVITELQRAGYLATGANKSVNAGINAVKSKGLVITSDSINLQREIKSYRYNPNQPDVPLKKDYDGMDAGRYGQVGLFGFGTIKPIRLNIPRENDKAY